MNNNAILDYDRIFEILDEFLDEFYEILENHKNTKEK